ncbi:hypothetical protein LRS06_02630 [Hymenobacter sp. J193]|uniref:hypothetical protein n=1 Tax=Hymenobacter sp. J193 TaxID=2898429 RepID=UPI00215198BA|nr:hypothetical protein [Hymenobacter sp. J193]MCR5886687.1 hypothetical protein [Hymenobacter sp. J193]
MEKPLQSYLSDFGETAKQAQDIARNLGLGAVAAVWIFKNPEGAKTLLPMPLVWALLLAVLGLGLDLVQYIVKAIWLYMFYRIRENQADALYKREYETAQARGIDSTAAAAQATAKRELQTKDVHAPPLLEKVTWGFFILKMLLMLTAYVVLARFLQTKL